MRLLIIGGSGTIGQAIIKELSPRHELIIASRQHGEIQVDLMDNQSIETMYKTVGRVDAVVSCAGKVEFSALNAFTAEKYVFGLNNKLMGQVNLVLMGLNYVNDNGSFTLISGILNRDPIRFGSSAAMVNGALDGFVKSAAIEMQRGLRINVISPTVLAESMVHYADFFPGFSPVPAAKVARAYAKSIEGAQTGQVYCVE